MTFEDDRGAYDQKDAQGFIKLNALRLRTLAMRKAQDGKMNANTQQIEFWNGPGGANALRAMQDTIDVRSLAKITEAVVRLAAPQTDERVLDIGCGCGTTTFWLRELVGRRVRPSRCRHLGADVKCGPRQSWCLQCRCCLHRRRCRDARFPARVLWCFHALV